MYEGKFLYGEFNGNGTFYYEDGRKYVGQFKSNESSGQGIEFYANGNKKYEG